ncbi:MAG TPA: hypothetical protein VHI93_02800 [Candidatus Thermoplasmatota archaeon]|nr:hypothetical protein [Candidatus Thermoplasmatota archaeon]
MKALQAVLPLLALLGTLGHAVAALPAAAAECGGPPCGYITPLVDLDFAGKPRCAGSPGAVELAKCIPLPAKGGSVSFTGTFRYYWKLSEDLTYPPGQEPVVVTFSGVSTNPKWMTFQVEPATVTLDAATLLSPAHMKVDQSNPSSPAIYYDFQVPIKVTFTRSGDPDTAALEKLAAKGGVADLFVKARSSASGAYFKEGFGVESFRFNAASLLPSPDPRGAPGGFLAPLAGIALAALFRRR